MNVTGNVIVEGGGIIGDTGRGYPSADGPGAGSTGKNGVNAGGAGYGGRGGSGSDPGAFGGPEYGSAEQPIDFGSGGGNAGGVGLGGQGGGSIRLTVAGEIVNNGLIVCNGHRAHGSRAGGGSGGSLWLRAAKLSGIGRIAANGGSYNDGCCGAGGGAGGRIAIYVCDQLLDPDKITASGGSGYRNGEPGTVVIREPDLLPAGIVAVYGHVVVDEPPNNIEKDSWESSTMIRVFTERLDYVLPQPLAVDATKRGVYRASKELTPDTLPARTVVNSHMLHFDPFEEQITKLAGAVTFDSDILGVMVDARTLRDADPVVGRKNVVYPMGLRSGLELDNPEAIDEFAISRDRRTLSYSGNTGEFLDQIRILTAVPNDCNGNQVVDICDILTGRSGDENNNNIPDECEDFQGRCVYQDAKVKAKGGCLDCPAERGCEVVSEVPCGKPGRCERSLKTESACPSGPGSCLYKMKRCDCR
ncbi:MAG: hypothetical protein C4547_11475 [Phycisphaerales bacterium]|nr:MAG: hypothetical protein C4547_11475 [Phycisphaerales bacterium]